MSSTSTAIYPSKDTDVLTIKVATVDEFPRCAGFLSSNMYASDIPKGDNYTQFSRKHHVDIALSSTILSSTKWQSIFKTEKHIYNSSRARVTETGTG